jgi:repressor LexA
MFSLQRLSSKGRPLSGQPFTEKQGQYLAFIHLYTKLHREPPAQSDLQRFFRVTPPTVHQMLVRLEELGLISRVPRRPRSIQVLVPASELPELK